MADRSGHTRPNDFLAWVIGGGIALLAWFSGNSVELPPELWKDISVAAGLRPATCAFSGLWQWPVSFFIDKFGIEKCLTTLLFLGPVSLGLLAAMTYRLFSGCLPAAASGIMVRSRSGRWIMRSILFQGTLFFVCSEPVWLAGRAFAPETLLLLITISALLIALAAITKSSSSYMILTGGVCGVLAAETPFAILPPIVCGYAVYSKYIDFSNPEPPPTANPIIFTASVRRMTWAFIFCWIASIAVNLTFFRANGGGGETDSSAFIATVKYLLDYVLTTKSAMSPLGWALAAAVVVLPLVIAAAKLRDLTNTQKLLPLPYSCFFAVAGTLAFLQSTGFNGCQFWEWIQGCVHSRYIHCLCLLGTSTTAMFALYVFATDIFFRNNARLMQDIFPEAMHDGPLVWRTIRSLRFSAKVMRFPARLEPLLAVALILPFRFDTTIREMSSIVNCIIRQTAEECGDAAMLFTDGSLDAAVEVAAAKKGKRIKALSMMSGTGKYDTAVRLRGETDNGNRTLLAIGTADALRTWVRTAHACASNIALQVGLELWRHDGRKMPATGGLVSRTAGFPAGDAEKWAAKARDLAQRILHLHEKTNLTKSGYPELNRLFLFGQWRISRMCRMRANEADSIGNAKHSGEEHSLADLLDQYNPEWQKIQEKLDWIGKQGGMRLTPREGLKLGLDRADFRLARPYARRVLTGDADDVHANFAMGMGYFTEKQYGRAEMHLKKCLLRAPNEPAVLNNLAIVQLRLGRFHEAETNAIKALEIFPNSSEIKTTLRHIRSAMKRDGTDAGK